ncbi:MAG: hypothetical protein OEV91_01360 [Desulfobulbaceae bacterium]|nr:hypothetical protein [Desulfobulbaceae bacterium]
MTDRQANKIWGWMREREITATAIASGLGHKTHAVVSNTIAGRKNNRGVLQWLIDNGCPVEFMDLPADMRDAA